MKSIDEPAFPLDLQSYSWPEGVSPYGLTKRELIAAMAMQGLIQHYQKFSMESMVENAVKSADLLLEELEK